MKAETDMGIAWATQPTDRIIAYACIETRSPGSSAADGLHLL